MRKKIFASEGAAAYLTAICSASILGYVFSIIMSGRTGNLFGMSVSGWTSYAITQFAFILVAVVFASIRKYDLPAVAKLRPSANWKHYVLLPFIAIATILVFYPLALLFMKLLSVMGYPVTSIVSVDYSNVGAYFLSLLLLAVIPAIGEELVCRGTLQSGLNSCGVAFSIFISALLFSLMHANPLQTVHQFGLGIVLALVYLLSGSLVPCIILHFLNNFITITVSAYLPEVDQTIYELGNWNWLTGAVSVVLGLVILAVLLYFYYRAGQPKKHTVKRRENTVEYDEFTFTVASEDRERKSNIFLDVFRFLGSLFTRAGWRKVRTELEFSGDVTYMGVKGQPMTNVWLSIGFAAAYWIISLVLGLL